MARRIIYLGVVGWFASIAALFLLYADWSLVPEAPRPALEEFHAWPWFRGTLALTCVSTLFPFFAFWLAASDIRRARSQVLQYAILYVWFGLLLLYPGLPALHVSSDSRGYVAFVAMWAIQFAISHSVARLIANSSSRPEVAAA